MITGSLMQDVMQWQNATFPGATVQGGMRHLEEEIAELSDCLAAYVEYSEHEKVSHEIADVIILAINIARLLGIDPEQAIAEKHAINVRRKWPKTPDQYGVFAHIEDDD